MLGDLIGEFNGKTILNRILSEGKLESTDQGTGKILGIDATLISTGVLTPMPNGIFMGEGNGQITTQDGDVVVLKISGIGWFTGKWGKVSFRGSTFHMAQSQNFMRLNRVVGLWEYDADENSEWIFRLWEWK